MAGPAKQFDRNDALNSAMALFWANGYEATSMQELVNTMGVNRASLYDTFGNKHAIYTQALDNYCEITASAFVKILNEEVSALQNLEQFFNYLTAEKSGLGANGCFVNSAAVELGQHDKDIAKKVNKFWLQIEGLFKAVLDKAVEQKEIKSTANTQQMAGFINTIMQGLAVKSKAGLNPKEVKATIELMLQALRA